jgi:hypothetical protein
VPSSKAASITIIAVCQVAAMAVWFSASAVVPALLAEYPLSSFAQALLTSGVQAGFVAGSLLSASLGLADRFDPRRFFMGSAAVAAAANALILAVEPTSMLVPLLRFITGMCMAGVYPVGMKLAATWAQGDMGLMVGLLVGALTLGSAAPHLFNAYGGVDWRFTLGAASASALLAAGLINLAGQGPEHRGRAALRSRVPFSRRGGCARCASPTSAISVTCGSSTQCGHGSAFFFMRVLRCASGRMRPRRPPPSS